MATTNVSQLPNTNANYHLTPLDPDNNPASIVGSVVWSTNRSDLVIITPSGPQGLDANISLAGQSGAVEAYATATNTNGVTFMHVIAIAIPVPPPPPPAADHFGVVQDSPVAN